MKRIINIIFRPSQALTDIANEEPIFSSLLIYALAVLAGNIFLVSDFFINWQSAVFNSLSLLFLWGGVIVLIDLILRVIVNYYQLKSLKYQNNNNAEIEKNRKTKKYNIF